ncbi:MAG: pilin [Azoarcus sp.]|nr:pilin [Azoarcus sp.]
MTEASQTGLTTVAADGFGCGEGGDANTPISQYVLSVGTSVDGVITVTAQGIAQLGTTNVLTFIPYTDAQATTAAKQAGFTKGSELAVKAWQCGGTGTTIPSKYLPASCR